MPLQWTYGWNWWGQSWGETLIGWTIGGGFEYAFTDHLTGFAEGDYYDFGSKTLNAILVAEYGNALLQCLTNGCGYQLQQLCREA